MQIIEKKVEEIHPYEGNAKKHPKKQLQQIADTIKTFGFAQPIVVDGNGVIIVGHGRFLAATEVLGYDKVPTIVLDPFLGSGSTLIASEKAHRLCYGIELDPKYVDVIVQRYVDFVGIDEVVKNGKPDVWKPSIVL